MTLPRALPDPVAAPPAPEEVDAPQHGAEASDAQSLGSGTSLAAQGGPGGGGGAGFPGAGAGGGACPPGGDCGASIVGLGGAMTRPSRAPGCPERPELPWSARAQELTGKVLAKYAVFADGHAGNISILNRGEVPPALTDAVVRYLERCPFEPAVSQGKALNVWVVQAFNFRLP